MTMNELPPEETAIVPFTKRQTVLVVDDTVKILNIIKFFLEEEGFTVKITTQPEQGIEMARRGGIDAIILDVMMPGLNGYQVYEILKQDPKTASTPVIMLTARAVIENTPRPFFYGVYGVLAKPFQRWKLVQMVKDVLEVTGKGVTQKEVEEAPDSEAPERPGGAGTGLSGS
ncbi:MAG: response regulator [Candidatus Brocadiae bacterium]|nr:response regulator [Candidatus Brocadiia bacterium]